MKYLPLIIASLGRRKVRTVFTFLSIFVAFFLFGYLSAIRSAFVGGVEVAGVDRMIMIDKVSLVNLLPESYMQKIAATEGVADVVAATWFGGYYQEQKNFFAQFPVDPEGYLRIYPEIEVSAEQRAAWLADRQGALLGKALAERFGWQPGDRIPITSGIWANKGGTRTWEFNVSGIFDGEEGVDTSGMLFHYDYFDEARAFGNGLVGWYIIRISDPGRLDEIAASLDAQFANSPNETKTSSEKEFLQGFANQVGDIGAIFTAIVAVVFFTLLLIVTNTMAQSVRERTADLAVMNVLGFPRPSLVAVVIGESLFMAVVAGGLGLGLAWLAVTGGGDPTGGFLPTFFIAPKDMLVGSLIIVLVGLFAGALPAWQALGIRSVEAMRRAV